MMLARPGLVVYSFAPKETPSSPDMYKRAREYLEKLWLRCDNLKIQDPVPNSNFSTKFSETTNVKDRSFRLVAAKKRLIHRVNQESYQAFLFEYQDVLGFVASLESNDDRGLFHWTALFEEWTQCVK